MAEDEEKLQLRLDVQRLQKIVKLRDEMIYELEEELSSNAGKSMVDPHAEKREKELKDKLTHAEMMSDENLLKLNEKITENECLRKEVERLNHLVDELSNRTILETTVNESNSKSFNEEEWTKLNDELRESNEERQTLMEQHVEMRKELLQLKEENQGLLSHVNSLQKHTDDLQSEISRLEGEIFDLKNSGPHATRGNSIFAEAMEAERKLEGELRTVFKQKILLEKMVKRLRDEKEEAEERARLAMRRSVVVKNQISDVDVIEINRLRYQVRELELEKVAFWKLMFVKFNSLSKKDLGAMVVAYFDSFKISMEGLLVSHQSRMKDLNNALDRNRSLRHEVAQLNSTTERLKFDIDSLKLKLASANRQSDASSSQKSKDEPATPFSASKDKTPAVSNRPSFFKNIPQKEPPAEKTWKVNNYFAKLGLNTPSSQSRSVNNENEEPARSVKKRLEREKAKLEPKVEYKLVDLTKAVPTTTGFKRQTLFSKNDDATVTSSDKDQEVSKSSLQ